VTSRMYLRGVTCFNCHDVHGTTNNADLRMPVSNVCLQCHGVRSPNGPHTATLEQHTHHRTGSAGSECVACHMPAIAQTLGPSLPNVILALSACSWNDASLAIAAPVSSENNLPETKIARPVDDENVH